MQHEEFLHRRFTSLKPKTISISAQTLAQMTVLDSEKAWPLVVEANVVGVDLAEWAAGHLQDLQARLLKTGAILFRNFNVDSIDKFKKFVHLISPELLEYNERSTPRTEVSGEIYTATTPLSETMANRPMSPVACTCVPPHNSMLKPGTETTRTLSPYFSPKSAIAPPAIASCVGLTTVSTAVFRRMCLLTIC